MSKTITLDNLNYFWSKIKNIFDSKQDTLKVENHTNEDNNVIISPNQFHVWGVVESLNITLGEEIPGVVNEYLFQFTCGDTPTSLALPDTIKWVNDGFPEIEANKTYQCSILNNIGVICGI